MFRVSILKAHPTPPSCLEEDHSVPSRASSSRGTMRALLPSPSSPKPSDPPAAAAASALPPLAFAVPEP